MEKSLNVFRIKTEWIQEHANGALEKTKTEELVFAVNYTDAENVAYAIAKDQLRDKMGSINIEIVKTKIDEIIVNNILQKDEQLVENRICTFFEEPESSGVGLYSVKVEFMIIDDKTGKEKRQTQNYYVPAASNTDATERIQEFLTDSVNDFVIRDAKFDKACAIYWPIDIYKSKTE